MSDTAAAAGQVPAKHFRLLSPDALGTCDWGNCDGETVAERWDPKTKLWLAVCSMHQLPISYRSTESEVGGPQVQVREPTADELALAAAAPLIVADRENLIARRALKDLDTVLAEVDRLTAELRTANARIEAAVRLLDHVESLDELRLICAALANTPGGPR